MVAKRVFPMAEWAPTQEAMYAEATPSTSTSTDPPIPVPVPENFRARSFSLSKSWRHRSKPSLIFSKADSALATKFAELSTDTNNDSSNDLPPDADVSDTETIGERRRASNTSQVKGKAAIRGLVRRASVSLKGIIPRRMSLSTAPRGEDQTFGHHRYLRSSHSHSQSQATNGLSAVFDNRPSTARPNSAWRRLRQAASFRHSRVLEDGDLVSADINKDGFGSPPVHIPGKGYAPPIIPANTGGAARAAAAVQNAWLQSEEWQGDRESGIGIAVTASGSETADTPESSMLDEELGQHNISKMDFVSQLPPELAVAVLSYLDAAGLGAAARVSRKWQLAVEDMHIWRESFLREQTSTFATSGPVKPGTGQGVPRVQPGVDWKEVYKVKNELDASWRNGKAKPVYLNGHSDSIYCLQFDESKIITGSRDRTIRVWDIHTLACRLVIGPPEVIQDPALLCDASGQPTHFATAESAARTSPSMPAAVTFPTHHKASILCLQYDDRILATGSSDASCIIYNIRSGYRPIRRLVHHSAAVLDLCFDDRYIVTCSKDISICVWDRNTGQLLKQLRGHSGPVNAVQMRGNTIVSCSGDFKVKLWNIDTGRPIREFAGHTKGLACSQFSDDGRYVASAGNDRVIRVWDANTGECVREMKAHENLVRSLHIDSVSGRLVSGSYDTDIKVFDMESGRQLLDFPKWHASWVLSAKSDYRRIISTGQDPKILIMDFGAGIEGIERLESRREGVVEEVFDGGYF